MKPERSSNGAILSVAGLLALFLVVTTLRAQEVVPGGVVVWPGDATRCGRADGVWEPIGGDCWYPVDLLESRSELSLVRWRGDLMEVRRVGVAEYPYEVQHIELKDDSKVDLSADDLARVRRENQTIGALWGLETPRLFALPLARPLADLPEGGRFGSRRFFNGQPRSPHSGADYAVPEGTSILAVADGTVALAGDFFFSGGSVFVDHGDGLVSMYFHLSEIAVTEGVRVNRGERIGAVGATGRATGPHLHFGVRWRGARIDPARLLGEPSILPPAD